VPPDQEVLRPAVQAEHRRRVGRPGLRDVHADARREVMVVMSHTGDLGKVKRHRTNLPSCDA